MDMNSEQTTRQIKQQIELLVLEAIYSVLKKLTQQIGEIRKDIEMKF